LLRHWTTFEEQVNCDLYLQEISDVLSTLGASVANALLVDFREADKKTAKIKSISTNSMH